MTKKLLYSEEARIKLKKGIDTLADAVSTTLGPKGRNVVMEVPGGHVITKDGVSVAKEIYLSDKVENLGAQMLKEVAMNTNKQAGDGTTTATVLAQAILKEGFEEIKNGREPIDIKRELDNDLLYIVNRLEELKEDIAGDYEKIYQIAKVSTNGDENLASMLTGLIEETQDSNILLDVSKTSSTHTEFIKGMSFNSSYIDSWFINSENRECILTGNLILIYDGKLNSVKELMPLFEYVKQNNKTLTIIAEGVSPDILITISRNRANGLNVVVLNSPGFGPGRQEAINDIAIYTGGEVIKPGMLSNLDFNKLGEVEEIIVQEDKTLIKEGKGNPTEIENRIKDLESILDKQDDETRKHTEKRISKFKGGIGVIYIGANSQLEYKEKYDRIEDAVNSIKAALTEGIISGGGTTLYRISSESDNPKSIINKAIKTPYLKIKENCGIKKYDNDIDYVAYLRQGIIDPKKVTRCALENAVSVAGTILTTEAVIVNEREI